MPDSPKREHNLGGLRAGGTRSRSARHPDDKKHADRWANRWHADNGDQGRRGVASQADVQPAVTSDVGKNHTEMAEMLPAMHLSMIQALRGIAPKQNPPRLTESTPETCDDFIRLWDDFQRSATAVDKGIAMRTCMSENTFATICHLSEFLPPAFHL